MLSDVLVAFDHLNHTITALANVYVPEPDPNDEAVYDASADPEEVLLDEAAAEGPQTPDAPPPPSDLPSASVTETR